MEYEIKDDPQGLPDRPDGERDGGLDEDPVLRHRESRPSRSSDDPEPVQPGDL